MSLRPTHLIVLMAWAVVMWDQTLLVETADQGNKNVSSTLRDQLPPGIIVPLPYVYPEYVDPREQTKPPTVQDNRATKTSVSDVILEDVTKIMLESMSVDEAAPIVPADINNPDKKVNDNNDESMANKQLMNNQFIQEITRRPSGNRPIKFGTRLKTSTAHSANQDFLYATSSTTTSDMKNETKTNASNEKPIRNQSSSIRIASRKRPINVATNDDDVSLRKRPVSKVRKVVTRRRRPNVENSKSVHTSVRRPVKVKNTEPESAAELEKPNMEAASKAV